LGIFIVNLLLAMSCALENSSSRTSMHPKPKNHIALYGAASLLAAAGISAILNSGGSSPAVAKTSPHPGKSSPAAAIGNRMAETALAAQGLLWERGAAGQKELRASIPV
jgi:hypothetical protein